MKRTFCWFLMVVSIPILLYFNKLNLQEKELLTKNSIFDMIDNVDNLILSCITKYGVKELSNENKIDFAVRYIIDNRDNYKENIILEEKEDYCLDDGTVCYSFGKVKSEFLAELLNKFFTEINFSIEDYKYFNKGFVNLCFEPMEYIRYDTKTILNVEKIDEKYIVYIQYTRSLAEFEDQFYVKYEFRNEANLKMEDVTIYN